MLMAALVYSNYYGYLHYLRVSGFSQSFLYDFLLYFFVFATAWVLQKAFTHKSNYLSNGWLISLILLCPLIFSIRVNSDIHSHLLAEWLNEDEFQFWNRCTGWILRASVLIFLIYVLWFFKDRHSGPLYGTRIPSQSLKPSFILISFSIPLVILAASQYSFLNIYPRAEMIDRLDLPGKPWRYLLFESSYAFDFLSIELFFRGLLIIGFMRICGMNCIIPAACFYCCIHFGKPMGEAISSYFGGIFLGIIAYHTKSIKGGLVVHIGLAMLMEIAGFIAHWLSN